MPTATETELMRMMRVRRAMHRLTQKQVASRVGVATDTITRVEGGRKPSRLVAYRLADWFGVDTDTIMRAADTPAGGTRADP